MAKERRRLRRARRGADAVALARGSRRRRVPSAAGLPPADAGVELAASVTFWEGILAPGGPAWDPPPALAAWRPLLPVIQWLDFLDADWPKMAKHKAADVTGCTNEALLCGGPDLQRYVWHLLLRIVGEPLSEAETMFTKVILIPKTGRPLGPLDYRPISLQPLLTRLLGRQLARDISAATRAHLPWWALGFRAGCSSLEAAWSIATLLQKRHAFRMPSSVLKMDVYKAFDATTWQGALDAMRAFHVPDLTIEVLAKMWLTHQLHFEHPVDDGTYAFLKPTRGLPQGHGASAGIFVMTIVCALKPLVERWASTGRGVHVAAPFPLGLLVYYGDIVLFADSLVEVASMGNEVLGALQASNFSCQVRKSQWITSTFVGPAYTITLGDSPVPPLPDHIRILGLFLDARGRLLHTLPKRFASTWGAFMRLRHVWQNREIPLQHKLLLLQRRVFPSLWGLEALPPSRAVDQRIQTLQNKLSARALGLRLRPTEAVDEFCRRRQRTAKALRAALRLPQWHVLVQVRAWQMARHVACASDFSLGRRVHEWRPLWWQRAPRFLAPRLGRGGGWRRMRPGRPIRWESRIHAFWDQRGQAWTELDEPAMWEDALPDFQAAIQNQLL